MKIMAAATLSPRLMWSLLGNGKMFGTQVLAARKWPWISPAGTASSSSNSAANYDPDMVGVVSQSTTASGGPPSNYSPLKLAYVKHEKKAAVAAEADAKAPNKSPVIIQHGLFGCKENWKRVGKEINMITKRTVLSVDARNHGESPHSMEMSFALMSKDIRFLCKELNYDKISFIGHSMGGRVGLMLAMLHPRILDKLVVVDTTPLMSQTSFMRYQQLRKAAAVLKKMEPELKDCTGYTRGIVAAKAVDHLLSDKRDIAVVLSNLMIGNSIPYEEDQGTTSAENLHSSSTTKSGAGPMLWKVNLDAFLANPCLTDFPVFDENVSYHGRTLFLQGTKSQYIKREDEPRIRKMFPNAEFVWFKDCGHWIHVEKHTDFMKAVIQFLQIDKADGS